MAYTKVYAVHSRLDKKVNYALNEDKTRLSGMLDYALNPAKTQGEQRIFGSTLNCNLETAFAEMRTTQRKWNKEGGVVGYHFIQSFKPGEVTPEEAHAIGMEFARRCFGDRFEVVIGTHLDRHHLHNHVVVNSVSWSDGLKYHSSPQSYFEGIRGTSDALCREHGLSVIETEGRGKHYAEWQAEQDGKPTKRDLLRADLDEIIRQSLTYKSFLELLRQRGYGLKLPPRYAHTAVRPPWSQRFFRLDSLGDGYGEEAIRTRLQRATGGYDRRRPPTQTVVTYHYKGSFHRTRKLHGFRALYYHYLYFLGKVKRREAPPKITRALREDLVRFDRYVAQHRFLTEHNIGDMADLAMYQDAVDASIEALADTRRGLYASKRGGTHEEPQAGLSQIAALTATLRTLRGQQRQCRRIEADAAQLQERLRQTQVPQPKPELTSKLRKEKNHHEQKCHFQQRPPGPHQTARED